MSFLRRFFSATTPSAPSAAMEAAKATVIESIKDPRGVTMFSKSYCPYCKSAQKRIDKFLGKYAHPSQQTSNKVPESEQPYKVYEIDLLHDKYIQQVLGDQEFVMEDLKREGFKPRKEQTSVPNIWIGGEQVGGCDDLMAQDDDWIRAKLQAAGAKLL